MAKNNISKRDTNPAVETAKIVASRDGDEQHVTLTTGVRARILPVSATLIDEVTSKIPDPEVPTFFNEAKSREEPNPSDPEYLRRLSDAERKRGVAALDALVMFGVELLDGLPEDRGWLTKLQYMEKRGHLDLSSYDLNDAMDLEFLYKRFVAVSNQVLTKVGEISGVTAAEIAQAENSFPGNT
jgi:hypothetical protein